VWAGAAEAALGDACRDSAARSPGRQAYGSRGTPDRGSGGGGWGNEVVVDD